MQLITCVCGNLCAYLPYEPTASPQHDIAGLLILPDMLHKLQHVWNVGLNDRYFS